MKLYGFGPMRSLRALWGLKKLDTDFEFVPVNLLTGEHKHPDFPALECVTDVHLVWTRSYCLLHSKRPLKLARTHGKDRRF